MRARLCVALCLVACEPVLYTDADGSGSGDEQRASDERTGTDTGSGDVSGDVTPGSCEQPPCWRMADSPTFGCYDSNGALPACPSESEAGYGQDGNRVAPDTDYEILGTSVRDTLTGLVFSRVDGGSGDFAHAQAFCADLVADSWDDWRLPTFLELLTLYDFGHSGDWATRPAVDVTVFSNVSRDYYWTSDDNARSALPGVYWTVDFGSSFVLRIKADTDTLGEVMCVRGEPLPLNRFRADNGVVIDQKTGLCWAGTLLPTGSWQGALDFCALLTDGGHDDWVVPNVKELQTIVDRDAIGDQGFIDLLPAPANSFLYTSTPAVTPTHVADSVWGVEARNGSVHKLDYEGIHFVRCVRFCRP